MSLLKKGKFLRGVTSMDLFIGYNLSRFKSFPIYHPKRTASSILANLLNLAIEDILHNDTTFSLNKEGFYILMKTLGKDILRKIRSHGRYKDLDFLKTNFRCHRIFVYYLLHGRVVDKPVHIGRRNRLLVEYDNSGREYFGRVTKTYKDYLELLLVMFPKLDPKDIRGVIQTGLLMLCNILRMGADFSCQGLLDLKFVIFFGLLSFYRSGTLQTDLRKIRTRIRIIYLKSKYPYTGYYYCSFTESEYLEYLANESSRELHIKTTLLFKSMDECYADGNTRYHFVRVPMKEECRLIIIGKDLVIKDPEICYHLPLKFIDLKYGTFNVLELCRKR